MKTNLMDFRWGSVWIVASFLECWNSWVIKVYFGDVLKTSFDHQMYNVHARFRKIFEAFLSKIIRKYFVNISDAFKNVIKDLNFWSKRFKRVVSEGEAQRRAPDSAVIGNEPYIDVKVEGYACFVRDLKYGDMLRGRHQLCKRLISGKLLRGITPMDSGHLLALSLSVLARIFAESLFVERVPFCQWLDRNEIGDQSSCKLTC